MPMEAQGGRGRPKEAEGGRGWVGGVWGEGFMGGIATLYAALSNRLEASLGTEKQLCGRWAGETQGRSGRPRDAGESREAMEAEGRGGCVCVGGEGGGEGVMDERTDLNTLSGLVQSMRS